MGTPGSGHSLLQGTLARLATSHDTPFRARLTGRGGLLAALLVLGAAFGCASEAPKKKSVLLDTRKDVYVILPLNVAAAMPAELGVYRDVVWKELELYLRAHGKELKTLSRQNARSLWLESIQKARAGEKGPRAGFDDAALLLARELRSHVEFDAMLVPSLFVREATVSDRSARWDGVEQDVPFKATGIDARSLADTPLEGAAPAASLHVSVFDAQGRKLHEALGGLEVLVRVRAAGSNLSGVPAFQFVGRTDLFEDREQLREGFAAAFVPFLEPLPR